MKCCGPLHRHMQAHVHTQTHIHHQILDAVKIGVVAEDCVMDADFF